MIFKQLLSKGMCIRTVLKCLVEIEAILFRELCVTILVQKLNFGPANGEFRRPNMSVLASIRRVTVPNFQKSKNYSKTKVYKSQLSPTYHLY